MLSTPANACAANRAEMTASVLLVASTSRRRSTASMTGPPAMPPTIEAAPAASPTPPTAADDPVSRLTCSATANVVICPPRPDSSDPAVSRRKSAENRTGRRSMSSLGTGERLSVGGDVGGRVRVPRRGRHPGPERAALQGGAQIGREGGQRVRQLVVERGQRGGGDLPLGPDRRQRGPGGVGQLDDPLPGVGADPLRGPPGPHHRGDGLAGG